MKTLALNVDGDIDMTNGGRWLDGIEAVAQRVRIAIGIARGEWFLDGTFGIDYRGLWLVKSPDLRQLERDFRTLMGRIVGVDQVESVDFNLRREAREVEVSAVLIVEGERAVAEVAFDALAVRRVLLRTMTGRPSIGLAP